jgi:GNAT superfamily N-acetyltransferase
VSEFRGPRPLGRRDFREGFECGEPSLDLWLLKHALSAGAVGSARTYVVTDSSDGVLGFYALTVAALEHVEATARAAKGMPRHSIPAMLLSRLAVDRTVQGKGLGALLLRDALERTLLVADLAGVRLLLVHAMNDEARGFYERFGFEPSPSDPLNLQLLIKDIRATVAAVD